jgi:aminopeptidase Y
MTRPAERRRSWPAAVAAAMLALAACSPAPPSATPATSPPSAVDPTTSPSAGSPSPAAAPALATALRDAIDPGAIVDDLRQLETITRENGGTRAAGSDGYDVAASFVAEGLEGLGYQVTLQGIVAPLFGETGPGVLEIGVPRGPIFTGGLDFRAMLLSPSGDVTATVVALGFDPEAAPEAASAPGCDAADWADVPAGSIVLVQPGPCRIRTMVEHAQAAGAVGLVRSTPGWESGRVLRPTLIDPGGLTIPAIGATHQVGLALNDAAEEGHAVHLAIETVMVDRPTASVIAETPGGDPDHVVMIGGHLDSVIDSPGINDNGSGTMAVLEIARRLAALQVAGGPQPAFKVRVAFWAAEELGLWGSADYVSGLSPDDRARIVAYLNFDMLGSPNGVREVYRWDDEGSPSRAIEGLFGAAFGLEDRAWDTIGAGGSDDLLFGQASIPIGGLFSGHNTLKTADQVAAFGGILGEPLDPCYHLPCDTLDNVDPEWLGQMARAAAWVVGALASGEVDLGPGR